ncbi:MAG: TetR family transcriptional regulator [Microbacteriaceae bacterium]|nr:TetR family transcriptional regulator [Microbacteriaceae bacterium]
MTEATQRGRGRPRAEEGLDTRAELLRAAGEEFAERGYEGTSVRGVARRAGFDAALVHHYFGDKAGLFAAMLQTDVRPTDGLEEIFAGPREDFAASYLRFALERFEQPEAREQMVALIRTSLGSDAMAEVAKGFVASQLDAAFERIAVGPDPAMRARLVSTQLFGLFVQRFVLRAEPLASAPVERVVTLVAPTLHRYLFED